MGRKVCVVEKIQSYQNKRNTKSTNAIKARGGTWESAQGEIVHGNMKKGRRDFLFPSAPPQSIITRRRQFLPLSEWMPPSAVQREPDLPLTDSFQRKSPGQSKRTSGSLRVNCSKK